MKRYFLLLSFLAVIISSCKKSSTDTSAQAAIDDQAIQAYISANAITGVTKDASGLYYKVLTQGSGSYPTATSTVAVNYTGRLLNGALFDQQSSLSLVLSNTIKGWQIGIPKINAGGTILLLIPSALGYGTTASGSIPANSPLMFNITLQGFHN